MVHWSWNHWWPAQRAAFKHAARSAPHALQYTGCMAPHALQYAGCMAPHALQYAGCMAPLKCSHHLACPLATNICQRFHDAARCIIDNDV